MGPLSRENSHVIVLLTGIRSPAFGDVSPPDDTDMELGVPLLLTLLSGGKKTWDYMGASLRASSVGGSCVTEGRKEGLGF